MRTWRSRDLSETSRTPVKSGDTLKERSNVGEPLDEDEEGVEVEGRPWGPLDVKAFFDDKDEAEEMGSPPVRTLGTPVRTLGTPREDHGDLI